MTGYEWFELWTPLIVNWSFSFTCISVGIAVLVFAYIAFTE